MISRAVSLAHGDEIDRDFAINTWLLIPFFIPFFFTHSRAEAALLFGFLISCVSTLCDCENCQLEKGLCTVGKYSFPMFSEFAEFMIDK